MAELTEKAGLPRPEIEEQAGCVVVRFRPGKYIPPRQVKQDLTERQRAVLGALQGTDGLALREIKERVPPPFEEWELKNDLAALKLLGLVDLQGRGRVHTGSCLDLNWSSNSLQFTPIPLPFGAICRK